MLRQDGARPLHQVDASIETPFCPNEPGEGVFELIRRQAHRWTSPKSAVKVIRCLGDIAAFIGQARQ